MTPTPQPDASDPVVKLARDWVAKNFRASTGDGYGLERVLAEHLAKDLATTFGDYILSRSTTREAEVAEIAEWYKLVSDQHEEPRHQTVGLHAYRNVGRLLQILKSQTPVAEGADR